MENETKVNEQTPTQPQKTVKKVVKKKVKKENPVVTFLNKYFHFKERGGTLGGEISGGVISFIIAFICLIYNTNLMYQYYGAAAGSGTFIAGTYLATAIVMFLGTLAVGIFANLPLVQSANIGLSSVIVTSLAMNTGLTYANVMLITFISALIYLGLVVSPLYKHLLEAIPSSVKKGLPVALGLTVMGTAVKNAGFIGSNGGLTTTSSFTLVLDKWYFWVAIIGIILFFVLKQFSSKKLLSKVFGIMIAIMWLSGFIFFMDVFVGGETAGTIVYGRLNVFFATDGASPYTLGLGISELINVGALFTKGFDFSELSANGGSPILVIIQGVLTYLALGIYTNAGYTSAACEVAGLVGEDGTIVNERRAHIVAAACNVVAPIVGAGPTSIGAESTVNTEDGAKTGLSSIIASLGFIICCFTWLILGVVATKTFAVGMWIEESEIKLVQYVQDVCIFADVIMVIAGACMLKGIKKLDITSIEEIAPFAALIIGTLFLGNIAIGVALGCVLWGIVKLLKREWKEFSIAKIVVSVLMLALVVVSLI